MEQNALRNFRDFLQLYNKMTEICFTRCIDNVNSRNLDENEIECVEDCSSKFVKFNNKLMHNFVNAQTEIVNKRVEEVEKQQLNASNSAENKVEGDKTSDEFSRIENNALSQENVQKEVAVSQ